MGVIKKCLGVDIFEIVKYDKDPDPIFFMKLTENGREIPLGIYKDSLQKMPKFLGKLEAVLMGTKVITKFFSSKKWKDLLPHFDAITVEKKIDNEAYYTDRLKIYIDNFLNYKQQETDYDEYIKDCDKDTIYCGPQHICFRSSSLCEFIKTTHKDFKNDVADVEIWLYQLGGKCSSIKCTDDGTIVKVWEVEINLL